MLPVRTTSIIYLAALVTGLSDPAAAQYRTGVPAVLAPEPVEIRDEVGDAMTAFKRWYAARRSPRILIFWNRELTDDILTRTRLREIEDGEEKSVDTTLFEETVAGPERVSSTTQDGLKHTRSERTSEDEIVTGGEFTGLERQAGWRMESAFVNAFFVAGARLIDRSAAVRLESGARAVGPDQNLQWIESRALSGKADLLIEVLPLEQPASPTGMMFRVKATRTSDGQVLAQFLSAAEAYMGEGDFAATAGDFEWVDPPRPTLDHVGGQLAIEAMRRLAAS